MGFFLCLFVFLLIDKVFQSAQSSFSWLDLVIPVFKVIFMNKLRQLTYLTVLAANFRESFLFSCTHTADLICNQTLSLDVHNTATVYHQLAACCFVASASEFLGIHLIS